MDVSAVVLNKILSEKNLDAWTKIKLSYLDSAYSSLYSAISRHYEKFSTLPSFDELDVELREGSTKKILATIKLIDTSEVDTEVAVQALIDSFTQNTTVNLLDKFIDKLPVYDSNEIKDNLANIVLELDDKTLNTENVFTMADLLIFKSKEEISQDRIYLGLNNSFDATLNGMAREEYLLIGGPRGSGKSIVGSNIACNQYENGDSCVYFTIEMTAKEIHERNCAILSDVSYKALQDGTLNDSDLLKVVKMRAGMFENSDDLVESYLYHKNRFKFEEELIRTKKLKSDNQLIIVDNRKLTITSIDLYLGKLKSRFKDKLKVAVVDYINQIKLENGADQYDWKPQIEVSTRLKDLARKHQVLIVSPYQIDSSGEARFSKGILDSGDVAIILDSSDKDSGVIGFKSTKVRGGAPLDFNSKIDWTTLRIDPEPVDVAPKSNNKDKSKSKKVDDSSADIPPWN